MPTINYEFFRRILLNWHLHQDRNLPWIGEPDPYKIWLSEIILQQTRAKQGLNYYNKFVEHYKTIIDLANASDDDVMMHWQGLGYYARAKNMLQTARIIKEQYNGVFPNTYEQIIQLKGVGTYTAAAISSFAFNLPHAVVDGNVYRVLSRMFGIETPIDSMKGKKQFQQLADKLLDKKRPAKYNQAIMDFGAIHCTPNNPKCNDCVFSKNCEAFKLNIVDILPVKEKKLKIKKRYLNYFYITDGKNIIVQKRMDDDIWQHLYQFPLIETNQILTPAKLLKPTLLNKHPILKQIKPRFKKQIVAGVVKQQQLTHQLLHFQFYLLRINNFTEFNTTGFELISMEDIKKYGFPKSIADFLGGLKEMVLFF